MSNVETKQIIGKNVYDYTAQIITAARAGWDLAPQSNAATNILSVYKATLIRNVDQGKEEVVKETTTKTTPKAKSAKASPVEADVKVEK